MGLPDRALRERLYSRFLTDLGVAPTPEMLGYLADRPVASVREIIGTANRIVASAEVKAVPVTAGFVRAELQPDETEPSRNAAMRTASDPFFLDGEKIVWQWPDAAARLVEELR
jgi:chromosomal replication initiation ATPase DnaA